MPGTRRFSGSTTRPHSHPPLRFVALLVRRLRTLFRCLHCASCRCLMFEAQETLTWEVQEERKKAKDEAKEQTEQAQKAEGRTMSLLLPFGLQL